MKLKMLSLSLIGIISITVSGCSATNVKTNNKTNYSFENANYWHHDYKTIKNYTNKQGCAELCAKDSACRVASFHDSNAGSWANVCVLRNEIGPRHTEQAGISSWVK